MNADLPPKRGRPRDPERLRRVLVAAAQQFTQLGYERTSVESVAQASGVSKMTVYSYFPSKEALFDACIENRCSGLFDLFVNAELDPRDPATSLTRIAELFVRLMRDQEVLDMHRSLFGSASTHAEVCASFWQQGPAASLAHVAAYLAAAAEIGTLRIADPQRAADQFLSLFLGAAHIRALLGLAIPEDAQDASLIQENVALFLRACRPTGG
jgi:TetR/AcrR family transcriptional repressor of mexJK operon